LEQTEIPTVPCSRTQPPDIWLASTCSRGFVVAVPWLPSFPPHSSTGLSLSGLRRRLASVLARPYHLPLLLWAILNRLLLSLDYSPNPSIPGSIYPLFTLQILQFQAPFTLYLLSKSFNSRLHLPSIYPPNPSIPGSGDPDIRDPVDGRVWVTQPCVNCNKDDNEDTLLLCGTDDPNAFQGCDQSFHTGCVGLDAGKT
jgi:hypothetical protein